MSSRSAVVCLALLALTAATEVTHCPELSNANFKVELDPCKKAPCRLVKGTNQFIEITFTPVMDTDVVTNKVSAQLAGLLVPFIGVDGNTICDKLYTATGEKASCPVKAGTPYTYKDSFFIHTFYPRLSTIVHWELQDAKQGKIVCFEVPAKIGK